MARSRRCSTTFVKTGSGVSNMDESKKTPWPTCLRATAVFTVILVVLTLMGCTHTPEPRIVPEIRERKIEVPASLLKCLPEPVAREAWKSQRDVAIYMIKLAEAGQDCRLKLEAVRKMLATQ